MALKPEPMQRVLIVASKGHQQPVIEALHGLRAAHFIEFHEQKEGEFAEFRLGRPLAQGEAASGFLVRVRALLRNLGLEGAYTEGRVPPRDLDAGLPAKLDHVEGEVSRAVEGRETLRSSLQEGRETEAKLEPLSALPLKLEDLSGYDTLQVFVGRADVGFRADLARVAGDHLLAAGAGEVFALFVPKARAAEVSDHLYKHGYAEIEVPQGLGAPGERMREIQAERGTLAQRLEKADAEIVRLATEHKDFLLAAEEHLSIQVEKAEAPLSFASSENAFVVDAWIPMGSVSPVEAALKKATRDNIHFARLETSDEMAHDDEHHHDHAHGGEDSAFAAHANHPAPKELPPTKYANGAATKRFEWFTELFSTPRYNEIDPTAIFAIFFPLFFGFMIGDLGLGLVMVGLGWLLARKLPRVDGMKQLGTALMIAGVIAAVLGGFVFKDALGIPLGVNHHIEDHVVHVLEDRTGAEVSSFTCHDVYKVAHEATWTCIVNGKDHVLTHYESWSEPIAYKVTGVPTMLLLSVLAGFVHLFIGMVFGIRNEWGHGGKHLFAKFGYFILLLTFFPVVLAMLRPDVLPVVGLTPTHGYIIGGVGFALGAIILGATEGFGGILEIPSMFSAIMSYLRLGAVAIAKGAMAIAFNSFTLLVALEGGTVALILGAIGFVFAQIVLLVLGLLSGGIQALRLNFVEFFTKFYKGGGTPYRPFGRERVYTAPATGSAAGATAAAQVMFKP